MNRWRTAAAGVVLFSSAAICRADGLAPGMDNTITSVLERVGRLQQMEPGRPYTLPVAGQPVTAERDYFVRRRTGKEVLESGMTSGTGDSALAALHLFEREGLQTQFADSVRISTKSLENAFSGYAVLAVHDPRRDIWVRVDPTRNDYAWPWTVSDTMFYGDLWIGFRGRWTDYLVRDPESLKRFYRKTLDGIPKDVLNRTLFRFRYTVDQSLKAPDGRNLNQNLEAFLRENGKALARRGIEPSTVVPIRLTRGEDNGESRLEYSPQSGWVCRVGLRSAMSLSLVSYLEGELVAAREKGPLPGVEIHTPSYRNQWIAFGTVCAALIAILIWQRRRLAGRGTLIAYWALQILGWSWPITLGLTTPAVKVNWDRQTIIGLVGFLVTGVVLSHLLRYVIRRYGWLKLSSGRMLLRLVPAAVVLGLVQELLLRSTGYTGDRVQETIALILMYALWIICYVLLTAPRRQREAETQLQLALREAELRALEAQVHPHFLFNSLNSIRGLVVENPPLSQELLTRLANILRYNLRRDLDHTVPLHSEVEIVADYLAIESARFEDRLRVDMQIDPAAGEVPVPPMLLQSLVENALKHGIAPLPDGGELRIRAALSGDEMRMEVENSGEIVEARPEATQTGLANIRERLRLLYDGRASFELKTRDGHVAAVVVVPRTA